MFRISDTIRRTETVDGGILLDVHHGQMFCLNVVGTKILELMQRGYDESRIADEISRSYGEQLKTPAVCASRCALLLATAVAFFNMVVDQVSEETRVIEPNR